MGAGSGLFFAPFAAAVLGAVPPHEHGTASGVSTTVRELAVVLGVTVLGAVFAAHGDLDSPARTLAGVAPALWLAAALAGAAVLVALALPARPRSRSPIGDIPVRSPLPRPGRRARRPRRDPRAARRRLRPLRRRRRRRRVGRLPRRPARPRPARPRRRVARRRRRRGDRRLRGVLPRCHRPGPGLAARMGERPRTRGAPVPPRPRRRRRAPPRVGAAHPRVGRAGLRLPHLPVHGHRTGALRADGLRAGPGVRPRHERPLRRARGARPWPALAYLKPIDACPAACADAA